MKIFIQGISSWVGHYAVNYLKNYHPEVEIFGSFRANRPNFEAGLVTLSPVDQNSESLPILEELRPDFFLHLARGEEEDDLRFHQNLIPILNRLGIHYGYASSFNACDSNTDSDHLENEVAHAQTDYGKFKAACEMELIANSESFSIFRFAAVHGWAPNRVARTEQFLTKLNNGNEVTVDFGVLQNRVFVGHLAGMMVDATLGRSQGVFHLGPQDSSFELDFLRRLAGAFGYSEHLILEGKNTPVNAFMVPGKILQMAEGKWCLSEDDTISEIVKTPELQKYRFEG